MGLDMYLVIENKRTKKQVEFSYYRKFNALQGYFEKYHNLENGGVVHLSLKEVEDIPALLNEVDYNPDRGPDILPTYRGFFFGTYEYDNFYYSDVSQATSDFRHAKFIDFDKYNLYFTSNW